MRYPPASSTKTDRRRMAVQNLPPPSRARARRPPKPTERSAPSVVCPCCATVPASQVRASAAAPAKIEAAVACPGPTSCPASVHRANGGHAAPRRPLASIASPGPGRTIGPPCRWIFQCERPTCASGSPSATHGGRPCPPCQSSATRCGTKSQALARLTPAPPAHTANRRTTHRPCCPGAFPMPCPKG